MGPKHKLFIEVTQYIQELIDSQQYDEAKQILQVNSLCQFVDNENEEWRDTYIQSIVNKRFLITTTSSKVYKDIGYENDRNFKNFIKLSWAIIVTTKKEKRKVLY